jgi:hypothetical protein
MTSRTGTTPPATRMSSWEQRPLSRCVCECVWQSGATTACVQHCDSGTPRLKLRAASVGLQVLGEFLSTFEGQGAGVAGDGTVTLEEFTK